MGLKVLAIFAVLFAIAQAPVAVPAQFTGQREAARPGASRQAPAVSTSSPADPPDSASTSGTDSVGGLRDYTPPHVTVATAAPAPSPWTWQERVAWGANILLAFVGYAGVMLVYILLKKIERQTAFGEVAAEAAAKSAHAALLNAQAVINCERPWILITVEPSRSTENSFTVMATNRGRTPAIITATADRTRIAVDERHLPGTPEYRREEAKAPQVPIILVPGESTAIKSFCRDEVKALCDSEERFKRIETWEEKVYLYGRVVYSDLISTPEDQVHETNWCCWYIHGRQNSGLVIAGLPEYNSHT